MYAQFFHFPPSSDEENAVVYEAIGRLDRLQPFHRDTIRAGVIALRLEDETLALLREWARGYITGELSRDIVELRQELIKELYT